MVAIYVPNGKYAKQLEAKNQHFEFTVVPNSEAKLTDIPALVWEAHELSTWFWFVSTNNMPYPQFPTEK